MSKKYLTAVPLEVQTKKLIVFFFDLLLGDFLGLAEKGNYTLSKQSAVLKVRDDIVNFILTRPTSKFTVISERYNIGVTIEPRYETEGLIKNYILIVSNSAETFKIYEENQLPQEKLLILIKDFDQQKI